DRPPRHHRLRAARGDRGPTGHATRHAGKGAAARQPGRSADLIPRQPGPCAGRPGQAQTDGSGPAACGRGRDRGGGSARTGRQVVPVVVAVVVDANLLVVIVSGDARGPMASAQIGAWITANQEIHAPELLPYEVASALTRLVAGHAISSHQARSAWETLP